MADLVDPVPQAATAAKKTKAPIYSTPADQLPQLGGPTNVVGAFPFGGINFHEVNNCWRAYLLCKGAGWHMYRDCATKNQAEAVLAAWQVQHNAYRYWYWVDTAQDCIVAVHRLHPDDRMLFDNNEQGLRVATLAPWCPRHLAKQRNVYAKAMIPDRGSTMAHREVMHAYGFDWSVVDHIDRDSTLDNRRVNLRDGSKGVNQANKKFPTASKHEVVGIRYLDKTNPRWVAAVQHNYKETRRYFSVAEYGGYEQAKQAAIAARREMAAAVGNTVGLESRKRTAEDANI